MSDHEATLREVAAEFGLTLERVRQIELAALRKFRRRLSVRLLEMHLDAGDLLAVIGIDAEPGPHK